MLYLFLQMMRLRQYEDVEAKAFPQKKRHADLSHTIFVIYFLLVAIPGIDRE